ncbi:hypothetical protein PUN28_008015 [Cardiocondyla obscurior]|uniref:Uncharacterized protein n=1 Tax=Cardiocondyla obscurior TaxID=286306 RepID=A0AAW2FW75_9HYME
MSLNGDHRSGGTQIFISLLLWESCNYNARTFAFEYLRPIFTDFQANTPQYSREDRRAKNKVLYIRRGRIRVARLYFSLSFFCVPVLSIAGATDNVRVPSPAPASGILYRLGDGRYRTRA